MHTDNELESGASSASDKNAPYLPYWSAKERAYLDEMAAKYHTNPVGFIRLAVGALYALQLSSYSARYILEEAKPDKLAELTGLPEGVIVDALKNILPKQAE